MRGERASPERRITDLLAQLTPMVLELHDGVTSAKVCLSSATGIRRPSVCDEGETRRSRGQKARRALGEPCKVAPMVERAPRSAAQNKALVRIGCVARNTAAPEGRSREAAT
jgi:hypothetical protein